MIERGQAADSRAWWLVCLAAAGGSLCVGLLPEALQGPLRWQADAAHGQAWTYWTAALTHLSTTHLVLNVLSMLLLAGLGMLAGAGRREAVALLLAWPLTHAALWAWPAVLGYSGLSGVSHAAAGVIVARGIRLFWATGRVQVLAGGLALLMVGKLLWEAGWREPIRLDTAWDFAVIQAAHLSGFAAGLLLGLLTPAAWLKGSARRR